MNARETIRQHERLWAVTRMLRRDYAPYGRAERSAPDCSAGCRHAHPLAGEQGSDWVVCCNPASHRAGLLTFEHQGCKHFEAKP